MQVNHKLGACELELKGTWTMADNWYFTNQLENAVDSLEMLAFFLQQKTASKWKWAAIAAHQSLYSLLICGLSGTAPRLTVCDAENDRGKAGRLHIYGVSTETLAVSFGVKEETIHEWLANPRLISIHQALKRMQDKKYLPWSNVVPLVMSKEEQVAVDKLIYEYRNEFEHFVPKTWAIYTKEMPKIFVPVMRVIRFVALESNAILYHPNDDHKTRVESALKTIEENLSLLQNTSSEAEQLVNPQLPKG